MLISFYYWVFGEEVTASGGEGFIYWERRWVDMTQ